MAAHLVRSALDRGITLRTETEAVRLVSEDGRAIGLVTHGGGSKKQIMARRGVLLATSGYDWSTSCAASTPGPRVQA